MSRLRVRLLRRFDVRHQQRTVLGLEAHKVRELFAYLLLHRKQPHAREMLASMMWPSSNAQQARKHLRQTLWQLRRAFDATDAVDRQALLSADDHWLRIPPEADVWVDTRTLEDAHSLVRGVPGQGLDSQEASVVQQALDLYRGDLLEGWYEEWCLLERERLRGLHLTLLGKQMSYYEARGDYEFGLDCGRRALQCDVAHERTHRRMMRLRYAAGDRTGALRQYQQCVAFLRDELEIDPSAQTVALYQRICSDRPLAPRGSPPSREPDTGDGKPLTESDVLGQLEELRIAYLALQRQLQDTIDAFKVRVGEQEEGAPGARLP